MTDLDDEQAAYAIETGVYCTLGALLRKRQMTLAHLSEEVGVSVVNLSILKNNRAKAIRFSTLTAICAALDCDIGEILTIRPPDAEHHQVTSARSRRI